MVKKKKEMTERYLVLLKNDANNLYHRIHDRNHEFMEIFSLKRDRGVFKEIFRNRYETMQMSELSNYSVEIIELADRYYKDIDELYWYLERTQDMPNTIEDEVTRSSSQLRKQLENLILYIDADLAGVKPVDPDTEEFDASSLT